MKIKGLSICANCKQLQRDHGPDEKCLFDSTDYREMTSRERHHFVQNALAKGLAAPTGRSVQEIMKRFTVIPAGEEEEEP